MNKIILVTIVIANFSVISWCSIASAQTDDSNTLRNQYSQSLKQLAEIVKNLKVSGVYSDVDERKTPEGKKVVTINQEFDYAIVEDLEKYRLANQVPAFLDRVLILNKQEQFALRRDRENSTYYLEQPKIMASFKNSMLSRRNLFINCFQKILGVEINDILLSNRTDVKKIENTIPPSYLVRFDFEPNDPARPKLTGRMTVEAHGYWLLKSYDVVEERRGKVRRLIAHKGFIEFETSSDGKPKPTVIRRETSENGLVEQLMLKVNTWEYGFKARDGFSLSFYGLGTLSSPPLTDEHSLFFWLVVVAITAIIIAFVIHWFLRNHSRLQED